jgi:hypothetical protein
MGTMRIEVTHSLPKDDAKARMQALGDYLFNKYDIKVAWDGDKASANGKYLVVTINGTMTVTDKFVDFEGKDPGFLFRGKAKDYLTGKITTYLDGKTPLDQLPRR